MIILPQGDLVRDAVREGRAFSPALVMFTLIANREIESVFSCNYFFVWHSLINCFLIYSYLKASTGFFRAALKVCQLTVIKAMLNVNTPAKANNHQLTEVLYAKFSNQ